MHKTQPCVREYICAVCNPEADGKGEQEQIRTDIPTTYIGETSRSIFERSREHYEGARKGYEKNHMIMEQGGKEQKPDFRIKVRKYFKTALACQVAEAVLIRRRGGSNFKLPGRVFEVPYTQAPDRDGGTA